MSTSHCSKGLRGCLTFLFFSPLMFWPLVILKLWLACRKRSKMDIRQFLNRKSIFDSRSIENMPDCTLRSEVQPALANDQGHRRAAEYNGALPPCPFIKGETGALVPFHNSIMCHFIVYKTTWNKFIAAIRAPRGFIMVFYNFCYYFWGQHCCWTKTSVIGNVFFAFYKFPLLSTLLLYPLPYRCSGVPANIYFTLTAPQTWLWMFQVNSGPVVCNLQW